MHDTCALFLYFFSASAGGGDRTMRPVPASAGSTHSATSCERKTARALQLGTSPDRSECPTTARHTHRYLFETLNTTSLVLVLCRHQFLELGWVPFCVCSLFLNALSRGTSGDLLLFSSFSQAGYDEVGVLLDNAEGRIEGWEAGDRAQEHAAQRSASYLEF